MASVNKVIIVGNLGRDPETRTFPSGDMVANVTVATTDRWRDKNTGENREATEWHRIVFNGRLAEIVQQYLRKGSQVYVEGKLHTRKWTDQASGQERYATEIRADTMQMLGQRQGGDGGRDRGGNEGYGEYDGGGRGGNDRGGYDRGGRGGNDDQRQRARDDSQYGGYGDNQGRNGGGQGGQRNADNGGGRGQQQDRSAQQQRPPRNEGNPPPPPQRAASGFDDMDDDIPF